MTTQVQKERMTCGISNIVLKEKSAHVSFKVSSNDYASIDRINDLFSAYKISHSKRIFNSTNKTKFESKNEVDSKTILQIWRNFGTSLRLHVRSDWRYLFFEIDNKNTENVNSVIAVFDSLKLPLYYHETMRGYHFFSVKPINWQEWNSAILRLQVLNPKYPPITLRVNANKYPNEKQYFLNGHVMTPNGKKHTDTMYFKKWIEEENFAKLREQYYLVWYSLANGNDNPTDKWSLTANDL